MTLLEPLKYELGTRNLNKYFEGEEGNGELESIVTEGISAFSSRKPFNVKATLTLNSTVTEAEVPSAMTLVKQVWYNGRRLNELKSFDVYAGDNLVDLTMIEETQRDYPYSTERKDYGEWRHDLMRGVLVFPYGVTGEVKLYGFGVPTEADLSPVDRRTILKYAIATSLRVAIPKMLATYDINVDGGEVKEKTDQYSTEAGKLLTEFDKEAAGPFVMVG
ncbi:MAG: hypothetical protein V1799_07485 [bacterium]